VIVKIHNWGSFSLGI